MAGCNGICKRIQKQDNHCLRSTIKYSCPLLCRSSDAIHRADQVIMDEHKWDGICSPGRGALVHLYVV